MTQPSENESIFNRGALHILTGAIAGWGARDGGEALERGVRVGSALQNSYLREKQFNQNQQDSQRYNDLREKSMNLDMQYKQKRLDAMDQEESGNLFYKRLDAMNRMSQQQTAGYRKEYVTGASQPRPTDGVTYPVSEKQAELIDNMTKGSETLADLNSLMYSMHEAETSNSKSVKEEAGFMSKALGLKHGISVIDTPNGKIIKTRHGNFPFSYESADKIRKAYENDVNSSRGKLEDIYRTRNNATSASQKFLMKNLADLHLDPKQSLLIAQQYSSDIAQNPVMERSMDLANRLDRLISVKDPKFAQMEKTELVNLLDKAEVKYMKSSDDGQYMINAASLNDYINRFNGGQRVEVADDMGVLGAMIPVDANLVKDIFNRSGLNNLKDTYINEAKDISDRRVKAMTQATQASFGEYAMKEEFKAGLAIREKVATDEALTASKQRRIVEKNDWTGASPDEVMDSYNFNVTEREEFERELSSKMSQTYIKDNVSFIKKKYKEFTGKEFSGEKDAKGNEIPMELDTTVIKLIQDLPEFQKQFKEDSKSVDRLGKTILRRMATPERRKAARIIDANDKREYKQAGEYASELMKKNANSVQSIKKQLDSILED
jgi:hypothetical protein